MKASKNDKKKAANNNEFTLTLEEFVTLIHVFNAGRVTLSNYTKANIISDYKTNYAGSNFLEVRCLHQDTCTDEIINALVEKELLVSMIIPGLDLIYFHLAEGKYFVRYEEEIKRWSDFLDDINSACYKFIRIRQNT